MNVPKLRFKEFNDEYKKYTFAELADYKKGPFGSALKKEIFVPKSENSVKVYEQQNAIKKDWTLERYFITKEYYKKLKGFTIGPGDIIVSCAGTIGEYYVLPNEAEIGVINQALMRIITNKKVNQNYFLYIFDNMVYNFSKTFSNGSAIKNIPPFADLKKQIAYIPTIEEQNKVSIALKLLDKKIELQSKKIEDLKLFKLCINNILFNGNKTIKLKDICECKSSTISLSDIEYDDGMYPIYGANGEIKKINSYQNDKDYLAIIKDGAGVGKTIICNKKSSIISTLSALIPNGIPIYYFNELIKKIDFSKYIVGSGIPHIYFKDYSNEKLYLHEEKKRVLINNFFKRIITKIELEENKLLLLETLKKGLMQNMFV